MKKMIVVALLAFAPIAAMATEQAVCTGTAGAGTALNAVAGTDFIKTAFTPNCSADTKVSVNQNTSALWGASTSIKGKSYFAGSTNGGTIKPNACAADPCGDADITSGMTAAAALGGSSTPAGT